MKKYHFVYKTTNRVNRKFYIGKHSTDSLNDGYLGSGYALIAAIEKYGAQGFTREILGFYDSDDDAYFAEAALLTGARQNRMCYNLDGGGRGTGSGENHPLWGTKLSEERIEKIIESNLGRKHTESAKKKISAANKGRIFSDKHRANISNVLKGRPHSEAHKKKTRDVHLGRKASEKTKRLMSLSHSGEKHWAFGKEVPAEQKEKVRIKLSKAVFKYNKETGVFICGYLGCGYAASDVAASKKWKSARASIAQCARGVLKSSFGFRWDYEKKNNILI